MDSRSGVVGASVKKILFAAAVAALSTVTAFAADVPVRIYKKAPPPAPVYDWTGFYVGVNVGGGVGRNRTVHPNTAAAGSAEQSNQSPAGVIGGGQAGYNWQFGRWLAGLETDVQASGQRTDYTCDASCNPLFATARHTQEIGWFGTTRGRLGLIFGPTLSYITGGVAYGRVSTSVTVNDGPTTVASNSRTKSGWTLGSGVEASLGGNWTGKIEYLYMNFGAQGYGLTTPVLGAQTVSSEIRNNVFRAGLNYNLNGNKAAPGPVANWTGFYIGGNAGGILGRNPSNYNNLVAGGGNINETFHVMPRGFAGGAQAGYNWQTGAWVYGVEADIQGTNARDQDACVTWCGAFATAVGVKQTLPWFVTARGRVGYAVGPTLVYATGGYARGAIHTTITTIVPPVNVNELKHTQGGYTVGGGIEMPFELFGWFGRNWTVKTEYLYIDLGGSADVYGIASAGGTPQFFSTEMRAHVFRTGINYRFQTAALARN
jgi:outer membrane immunogenic protein